MDYPLDWRQVFTTVFSLDKILKFSKIIILEFSDSPIQVLMFFLSRKTVSRVTQIEYFSDDALISSHKLRKERLCQGTVTKIVAKFAKMLQKLRHFNLLLIRRFTKSILDLHVMTNVWSTSCHVRYVVCNTTVKLTIQSCIVKNTCKI